MFFSKSFLVFISRLLITGIIVLGSFHFGSAFYASNVTEKPERIEVKNLIENVGNLPSENLVLNIRLAQNLTRAEDASLENLEETTSYEIQENKRILSYETIRSWIEPYIRSYSGKEDIRISPEKVERYLASIAPSVNIQSVDAKLMLVSGRAQEFVPSEYGRSLDIDTSKTLIIRAIVERKKEVDLPVKIIEPKITLEKVNELGITTLIGRGESDFKGSSQARVHNIRIGSAKYNGTILKPGELFSFNSVLGEVNEQNGFETELVIKRGKLIREAGGGLCQVSTTLFRSAIISGLPILERRPHSFPVRYYNPQGFDATIYPGAVDLKFKNDTSNHILIQSKVEGTKLIFDIYGPADGRKVVLEGPFQYGQKANGSMKAHFIRKIYQGNLLVKKERFDSNYGAPAPLERNPLE